MILQEYYRLVKWQNLEKSFCRKSFRGKHLHQKCGRKVALSPYVGTTYVNYFLIGKTRSETNQTQIKPTTSPTLKLFQSKYMSAIPGSFFSELRYYLQTAYHHSKTTQSFSDKPAQDYTD